MLLIFPEGDLKHEQIIKAREKKRERRARMRGISRIEMRTKRENDTRGGKKCTAGGVEEEKKQRVDSRPLIIKVISGSPPPAAD